MNIYLKQQSKRNVVLFFSALTYALFIIIATGCAGTSDSFSDIPNPKQYTYKVLNRYHHDSTAFTQGLVFDHDATELFEGTGLRGLSTIRRVDLGSGRIKQLRSIDRNLFGEGITLFNDKLYQLTFTAEIGFIYDAESFDSLSSFTYSSQGWGLTHDTKNLIMSDGSSSIKYLDPLTFAEIRRITVKDPDGPIRSLNELEYIEGAIWANVWHQDRIAIIRPVDGNVIGWLDLSGLLQLPEGYSSPIDVLNGIAYDEISKRIFVTGKYWPYLYEIELVEIK